MLPIVIGNPRRHWGIAAVVATVLTALGGSLIGARFYPVVGWIIAIISGSAAAFAAWQFYDARPRVVINDHGVLDRAFAIGIIPWADITDVHLKRVNGRDQLCLDLRNTKAYTGRLPAALRPMVPLNRQLGLTDLAVDVTGLSMDTAQLENTLRERLQRS